MPARLTRFSVTNVRSVASVSLQFETGAPLVVLGENGAGKSSLVEAFEILRKASRSNFTDEVRDVHGLRFLRHGSAALALTTAFSNGVVYEISLRCDRDWLRVEQERLIDTSTRQEFIVLAPNGTREVPFDGGGRIALGERDTALGTVARNAPRGSPLREAFEAVDSMQVHLPFSIGSLWGRRERKLASAMRSSTPMYEATRLERHGDNLAAAFHELKNGAADDWNWALRWVQRGLGGALQSVNVKLDSSGGGVVALKYAGLEQEVRADALSDGTLAWLAHVALATLARRHRPAVVVFDEPELHLHPGLQATLAELYSELAESCPVVLATQSDRLIDALPSPEASVVLCELDESRETKLFRPEVGQLRGWLERHRFADLRSDRLEDRYFTVPMVASRDE